MVQILYPSLRAIGSLGWDLQISHIVLYCFSAGNKKTTTFIRTLCNDKSKCFGWTYYLLGIFLRDFLIC